MLHTVKNVVTVWSKY